MPLFVKITSHALVNNYACIKITDTVAILQFAIIILCRKCIQAHRNREDKRNSTCLSSADVAAIQKFIASYCKNFSYGGISEAMVCSMIPQTTQSEVQNGNLLRDHLTVLLKLVYVIH